MAKILYTTESYVNATEGHRYGDSDKPQEAFTTDLGRLYRACVREYGRCTGKVYCETAQGDIGPIGWTFVKRVEYDDPMCRRKPETYLREVWVSVYHEVDDQGLPIDDELEYTPTPGRLPKFKYVDTSKG